ncbi:MAG: hypothetical protein WC346_05820 [Methanogenium sp.]|jgi:hypothetical protein
MLSLVSIPQVDISLLPLNLPQADGVNNGGYKLPNMYSCAKYSISFVHEYSPIDILVAGIEAQRRDIIITSLASFFDKYRDGMSSESDTYITLLIDTRVETLPISRLKQEIKFDKNLHKLMLHNAPLTFKWSKVYATI